MWDRVDMGPELTCGTVQQNPQINPRVLAGQLDAHSVPSAGWPSCVATATCAATSCVAAAAPVLLHRYLLRPPPSCDTTGGAPPPARPVAWPPSMRPAKALIGGGRCTQRKYEGEPQGEMASGGDPGVFGEAGIGPEIYRVHDWVPEG